MSIAAAADIVAAGFQDFSPHVLRIHAGALSEFLERFWND